MIAKIAFAIFIWWMLSQLIMWMLQPESDDEAVETWAAVFLAPVAIAYVVVDRTLVRLIRFCVRLFLGG